MTDEEWKKEFDNLPAIDQVEYENILSNSWSDLYNLFYKKVEKYCIDSVIKYKSSLGFILSEKIPDVNMLKGEYQCKFNVGDKVRVLGTDYVYEVAGLPMLDKREINETKNWTLNNFPEYLTHVECLDLETQTKCNIIEDHLELV